MTKNKSFLLQVNYLIRKDQYELRALASAVMDLTGTRSWSEKEAEKLAELQEFLNHLDEQDRHTWNKIVEYSEEK